MIEPRTMFTYMCAIYIYVLIDDKDYDDIPFVNLSYPNQAAFLGFFGGPCVLETAVSMCADTM